MRKTSTRWAGIRLLSFLLAVFLFVPSAAHAQDTPSLTIDEVKFTRAEGKLNQTLLMGQLHIKAVNMPTTTTIDLRGTNRNQFQVSVATIEAGTHDVTVDVIYAPTTVGTHKANIIIDCPEVPSASANYSLQGIAYDPAHLPTITYSPSQLTPFKAEVGQSAEQTLQVKSANAADYVYLKLKTNDNAFKLSTAQIYKNFSSNVKVTFSPKEAGTYENTLMLYSYGTDTTYIALKGVGTGKVEAQQAEGEQLNYTGENPVTTFSQYFDEVEKNKPFKITGWQNVPSVGTRAWWGDVSPDYEPDAGEKMAKVTPFDSSVKDGDDSDCTMLLVTPAIDFKNSKSKIFTFRVKGKYLTDDQEDMLGLYYMYLENGQLFSSIIDNINMPDTKDENDDWKEIHVDLSLLELPDVFSLYFGFASQRGPNHSATYYLDDITYGRTDIPAMTPSQTEVAFEAVQGKDTPSQDIRITAQKLTEPITLKIGGSNKSKYTLSNNTLPLNGGVFNVSFKSELPGVHSAYVKLASRGAADVYVNLLTKNNALTNGVEGVSLDLNGQTTQVYSLRGRLMGTYKGMSIEAIKSTLTQGTYIFKGAEDTRTIIVK